MGQSENGPLIIFTGAEFSRILAFGEHGEYGMRGTTWLHVALRGPVFKRICADAPPKDLCGEMR